MKTVRLGCRLTGPRHGFLTAILHEEIRELKPSRGNQYLKSSDLSTRLEYEPGDIILVDFGGKKQYYVDMQTCQLSL